MNWLECFHWGCVAFTLGTCVEVLWRRVMRWKGEYHD